VAEAFMWRDRIDSNQYWIGVRASTGGAFYGCIPLHIDAIFDCFGEGAHDVAKELEPGGFPTRVSLALTALKRDQP